MVYDWVANNWNSQNTSQPWSRDESSLSHLLYIIELLDNVTFEWHFVPLVLSSENLNIFLVLKPFSKVLRHFKTPNFKKRNILGSVKTDSFAFSHIYKSVLECWNIFAKFFFTCSISCEPKVKVRTLSSVGVLQLAKCHLVDSL